MTRELRNGYWTAEEIIAAIHRFNNRYGAPPSARDWNVGMAKKHGREDIAERFYRDGDYPHYGTCVRKFGRWSSAIEAAGFRPRGIGER